MNNQFVTTQHTNSIAGSGTVTFQKYENKEEVKKMEELKQQIKYLEEEYSKLEADVHRLIHVLELNGLIERSPRESVSFDSTWGRTLYTIKTPKGTDA